jgi:periplasmic protein TonB
MAAAAAGERAAVVPAHFLGNAQHPPYPERARALGLQGRVELRVTVGAGGEVLKVEVLRSSGQDELDRAAQTLLAAGPYTPARRAGVAIASRLRIGVPYTLDP